MAIYLVSFVIFIKIVWTKNWYGVLLSLGLGSYLSFRVLDDGGGRIFSVVSYYRSELETVDVKVLEL